MTAATWGTLYISLHRSKKKKKKESVMHMLFKVCCILMRNAKVNMGQVALCQKSGQWRIRNFSGLTFLRSKAQARPSHLCCICFKIILYSYKLYHNKTNETIIAIPKWFGLENTWKIILLPAHGMGRDQVTPRPIQPGLEHLQGWGINNFSSSTGTSPITFAICWHPALLQLL